MFSKIRNLPSAHNNVLLFCTFISGSGIGVGFMGLCTCVSTWFKRHLPVASGIATSAIGLSTFLYPPIIRALQDGYSWRGAYILLAAIVVQYLVVACFVKPNPTYTTCQPSTSQKFLQKYLQVQLLEDKRFLLLLVFKVVVHLGISIVFVHLESFASTLQIDTTDWAIPVYGLSNCVGRALLGVVGNIWPVNATGMMAVFITLSGIAIGSLPYFSSELGLLLCTAVYGLFSGVLGYATFVILVEYFSVHTLPGAYGYVLLADGVGFLLGAPAAGEIFGLTPAP